jgi:hypothetical protein
VVGYQPRLDTCVDVVDRDGDLQNMVAWHSSDGQEKRTGSLCLIPQSLIPVFGFARATQYLQCFILGPDGKAEVDAGRWDRRQWRLCCNLDG